MFALNGLFKVPSYLNVGLVQTYALFAELKVQ